MKRNNQKILIALSGQYRTKVVGASLSPVFVSGGLILKITKVFNYQ